MNPNNVSNPSQPSSSPSRPYEGLRTLAGVLRVLGYLAWGGGLLQACSAAEQAGYGEDPVMAFLLWFGISFTAGLVNLLTAELIKLTLDAKADLEQLVTKISALVPTPSPAEAASAADDAAPPASPQA